ncbi:MULTISPECIES: energy transducer TonB [Burkholderia]|uniref:Protein TonB n=1 Tax=Burkholderia mayonis TaxID=1385591 RepID=A0A1B4FPL7_9BURK|nr:MULTISPECIES: energy transducer TonB [Burkholderia]AOJ05611.1 energy transducer TonB [Burkholderia mayonis]KVE38076.1 energy transducer TonB [Burkholderia sp. BDU5]KVE44460.1 energy transducer TonB [Burkholderia mayonis]
MKVDEGLAVSNDGLARLGRPREFGKRQQNPARRFGGLAIVLALHIVLVYALLNGLATKVVQVIQHPIETHIIEPVKPPPPPPMPTIKLPPPKFAPPPPPFVPPPEVPVQAPTQPSITHQAAPVPSAPAVQAPVAAAPAPAKAVSHEVGVVCPNSDQIRASMQYPKEAQENNITGDVTIEFVVDAEGHVTNERVAQSADSVLDRAAFNAVKQFKCVAQGQSVRVQVPFSFNLN